MSKISRDAKAFAARVKMGRARVWVIVEGRVHDRPFYDGVMQKSAAAHEYSIRIAEQFQLDGVTAGGKSFLKSLFDYFGQENLLSQENKQGWNHILIALDRDLDHLSGDLVDSQHLIYTRSMDVESEILLHGDVPRAAAYSYSLTSEIVTPVLPAGRELASMLAVEWRQWIVYGACAMCCGVNTDVRYSQRSAINKQGFGPVDPDAANAFTAKVEEVVVNEVGEDEYARVRSKIDQYYERGEEWELVKGKWISGYVWHLLNEALKGESREKNVKKETLAKTCLGTLDFEGPWAQPYLRQIAAVLAA